MALEAAVFPQALFGYPMAAGGWSCEMECEVGVWDSMLQNMEQWNVDPSSPEVEGTLRATGKEGAAVTTSAAGRRKRRRAKSHKNKEEVENQRMTHIAVERNRRKQMNEYLAVLRSLMPPSYAHRGDQASIVGGAINFVKELEHLVQTLEAQKRVKDRYSSPFGGLLTSPQYSSCSSSNAAAATSNHHREAAAADVEVTMVESHASLKVLSRRRPKQLVKLVEGLQGLRLTTLHLNVNATTAEQMVLCCFSLKVEEDCRLTSVDEIAATVYQMVGRIQEEDGFN